MPYGLSVLHRTYPDHYLVGWRELNTRPKVYNILFLLKSFSLINSAYLLRIPSSPFTVFSFIPILLKMIFPFIKISSPLLTML
ncbi:hypothetical protein D0521_21060 [Salmonella enterica]|nr:hypothetical protein D0521_21060 [Salmonella enterica]